MKVKKCFYGLPLASKLQPRNQKKVEKKGKTLDIPIKFVILCL